MTARTRLKGRPAVQRSVPFGFSALRLIRRRNWPAPVRSCERSTIRHRVPATHQHGNGQRLVVGCDDRDEMRSCHKLQVLVAAEFRDDADVLPVNVHQGAAGVHVELNPAGRSALTRDLHGKKT